MQAEQHSFATIDLDDDKVRLVAKSRMHPGHKHLNKLLDRGGRGELEIVMRLRKEDD